MASLKGKKTAILATDGFEQVELTEKSDQPFPGKIAEPDTIPSML